MNIIFSRGNNKTKASYEKLAKMIEFLQCKQNLKNNINKNIIIKNQGGK